MHLAITVDAFLVVDVLGLQPLQVTGQVSSQRRVRVNVVAPDYLRDATGLSDVNRFGGYGSIGDFDDLGSHLLLRGPGRRANMTHSTCLRIQASLVSDLGARGLRFLRAHALRIDRLGLGHFLSPFAVESPSVSSMTSASTTSSSSAGLVGPADEGPSLDSAPGALSAAEAAAYIAVPSFWDSSESLAALVLTSAGDTPEPSLSASLRSFSAASTGARPSAGILSALSARNFSVE